MSLDDIDHDMTRCESNDSIKSVNGFVLNLRTALLLAISLIAMPQAVNAGKILDSKNSGFMPKESNPQLKAIMANVKMVIASIDSFLDKMRAVLKIQSVLKSMSEDDKKQFIDIVKSCGLTKIAKIEEVFNKKNLTPEDKQFLQSQVQSVLRFIKSNLLLYRKELINLLPRVQIIESSEERDGLVEDILDCIESTKGIGKI